MHSLHRHEVHLIIAVYAFHRPCKMPFCPGIMRFGPKTTNGIYAQADTCGEERKTPDMVTEIAGAIEKYLCYTGLITLGGFTILCSSL